MNQKIVYQCDSRGFLIGPAIAHESPEEPGVFHIPAGCIEVPPPAEKGKMGQWPCFDGHRWVMTDIPGFKRPSRIKAIIRKIGNYLIKISAE